MHGGILSGSDFVLLGKNIITVPLNKLQAVSMQESTTLQDLDLVKIKRIRSKFFETSKRNTDEKSHSKFNTSSQIPKQFYKEYKMFSL